MRTPPTPLEWHPFYRDRTWLLDWLERRGAFADHHHIRLPVPPPVRAWLLEEPDPSIPDFRELLLTREKCWGPAPYTGWPFVYVWSAASDHLGRWIAGEARIVYLDWNPSMPFGPWEKPGETEDRRVA